MEMDLIIWNRDGKTMKFENVTDLTYNTHEISFKYKGVSTGKQRRAVFFVTNITGFAPSYAE